MNEAIYANALRSRIAGLLRAYPDLAVEETRELIDFLARGAIVDVGYVSGDAELKPIVERVRSDHARAFRPRLLSILAVIAMITLPVAGLCAWVLAIASN